jgi:gliding motility-associated-like protein
MIRIIRFLPILFILTLIQNTAFATHNRAGEIIVRQVGEPCGLTIEATIITYTKASSVAADRDTLTICWGDGQCEEVARSNGPQPDPSKASKGEIRPNDIKYNLYIATHTYPGRARYKISMTDPNRNGGILNVNPPGSENVQFHLQTIYSFLNPQFQGCNDTPILLQPPIDIACQGQPFIHNPNAFDPDKDSLSYQLVTPLQDVDTPVPNYSFPTQVQGNSPCCLTLNERTGELIWDNPQKLGEYNIAMIIISWRNGVAIDTVLRDMQIFVEDCKENQPPVIETIDELCVVAGEDIEFIVRATDPDAGDKIKLSALGGPFEVSPSPAEDKDGWDPFKVSFQNQPNQKSFRWQTTCEHISNQYYQIVFKAVDNYFDTTGLADLKTVRIKVVGPPPENVQADPSSQFIEVTWDQPYVCEETVNDYFFGFSVWRREGSKTFNIDNCEPGLAGKGYTRIKTNTTDIVDGRYYFKDEDVERGRTYCYRILARFASRTSSGQAYNVVESLSSNEVCVQLSRDVPLITNVSVLETDPNIGQMRIRWVKPLAEDLDTLTNKGPYTYEVWRADGITNDLAQFSRIPGAVFTSQNYWELNQTTYEDQNLNTQDSPYSYTIAFYVNGETEPLGYAPAASSVWMKIASTDETNNISWDYLTPWENQKFTIYRQRQNSTVFDSIGQTNGEIYSEQGLVNGREYCYFVETSGSYGVDGLPNPLLNLSQEACGIPLDTIPPCPPRLTVEDICSKGVDCADITNFENDLHWTNPMLLCEETDDVVSYNVYYAPRDGADFELIASLDNAVDTLYFHEPENGIIGCYAVTALDTFFNESAFSNIECVSSCPIYDLANTFTPNEDGFNDLYTPRRICFVEKVEMQVFNRWGQLVFETEDPSLNWDGTNLRGDDLPDATYYYVCNVFEQSLTGISLYETKKGFIDIINSSK